MSIQACLDNIEAKTGKAHEEFMQLAAQRGYGTDTKAGEIVTWLREDFALGRCHALAIVHVIRNGAQISDKHVGSAGSHRDESSILQLEDEQTKDGTIGRRI